MFILFVFVIIFRILREATYKNIYKNKLITTMIVSWVSVMPDNPENRTKFPHKSSRNFPISRAIQEILTVPEK